MRTPTRTEINRIDELVKKTGQNIIDAIGVIKEMKQTAPLNPVQSQVEHANRQMHKHTEEGIPAMARFEDGTELPTTIDPSTITIGVDLGAGTDHTVVQAPQSLMQDLERRFAHLSKYARKQAIRRELSRMGIDDEFEISVHDDSDYNETKPELQRNTYTPKARERNIPTPETGVMKPSRARHMVGDKSGAYSKRHGSKKRRNR